MSTEEYCTCWLQTSNPICIQLRCAIVEHYIIKDSRLCVCVCVCVYFSLICATNRCDAQWMLSDSALECKLDCINAMHMAKFFFYQLHRFWLTPPCTHANFLDNPHIVLKIINYIKMHNQQLWGCWAHTQNTHKDTRVSFIIQIWNIGWSDFLRPVSNLWDCKFILVVEK